MNFRLIIGIIITTENNIQIRMIIKNINDNTVLETIINETDNTG